MKQKKLIIFILIFIVFLLLFSSDVLGYTTYKAKNNKTYYIPDYILDTDTYPYNCIFVQYSSTNSSTARVYVCQSNLPIYFTTPVGYTTTNASLVTSVVPYVSGRNLNCYFRSVNDCTKTSAYFQVTDKPVSTKGMLATSISPVSSSPIEIISANHDIFMYVDNRSSGTDYNNPTTLYSLPESYSNYPYFLNSDEDIAQGDKDLIIMPRRFCK